MSRYRSQVREVINRNTVVSLALDQGFNAFLPVYDGGVDFILYRESDGLVRKVQLKGRWTIERKYLDRDTYGLHSRSPVTGMSCRTTRWWHLLKRRV